MWRFEDIALTTACPNLFMATYKRDVIWKKDPHSGPVVCCTWRAIHVSEGDSVESDGGICVYEICVGQRATATIYTSPCMDGGGIVFRDLLRTPSVIGPEKDYEGFALSEYMCVLDLFKFKIIFRKIISLYPI